MLDFVSNYVILHYVFLHNAMVIKEDENGQSF